MIQACLPLLPGVVVEVDSVNAEANQPAVLNQGKGPNSGLKHRLRSAGKRVAGAVKVTGTIAGAAGISVARQTRRLSSQNTFVRSSKVGAEGEEWDRDFLPLVQALHEPLLCRHSAVTVPLPPPCYVIPAPLLHRCYTFIVTVPLESRCHYVTMPSAQELNKLKDRIKPSTSAIGSELADVLGDLRSIRFLHFYKVTGGQVVSSHHA